MRSFIEAALPIADLLNSSLIPIKLAENKLIHLFRNYCEFSILRCSGRLISYKDDRVTRWIDDLNLSTVEVIEVLCHA